MQRRYNLLGTYSIEEDHRASRLMKSDKGCALMAVLIIHGRPLRREYAADLLWESVSTTQSLTRLRVLMSRIRKWTPELHAKRKELSFVPTSNTWVDLQHLRKALSATDIQQIDEGLRFYSGDLLAGFYLDNAPRFNEWLLLEQERLSQRVINAHRQVSLAYVEQEAFLRGVDIAQHWLRLDELDEEALRYLLQFLAATGQIDVALRQYEHSRRRLWDELRIEPEQETTELIQRLTELKKKTGGGIAWDAIVGAQLSWPEKGKLAEPGALPVQSYLPYQRNMDFTGRRESLIFLADKLLPWPENLNGAQRVAAVTGMGGLGKTQLAVEFAYCYGRFFPGGVYWMSFAQADDVAEEVAFVGGERGMGLYQQADNLTLMDRVDRVQKAWQKAIPRLLIFDNCEDETLLNAWLPKTGGARVLLTSRRGDWSRELGISQQALPVLSQEEGGAFLQRVLPELEVEMAQKISAEVGHLPLALHLAGRFLRRYPQIGPIHYLAQLQEMGGLHHPSLQGRGARHSPTGHELNIARTFAVSMERLNSRDVVDKIAIRLLAASACFAPGEPIPHTLLRACVLDEDQDLMSALLIADGLNRLVVLGFLEDKGHGTVVLHYLLTAYVLEELDSSELLGEAQTAVQRIFVDRLRQYEKNEGHLSILPMSVVHLSHVTESALRWRTQLASRLAVLLGHHLRSIGSNIEAERLLKRANQLAQETGDAASQIDALLALAKTQEILGRDEASLESAQMAIGLLNEADKSKPNLLAEAFYRIGWACFRLGRAEEALAAASSGYEQSRTAGIPNWIAAHLNLMGVVNYYLLGNYEDAAGFLEQALALYQDLGVRKNEASLLNNLGETARLQGDYQGAARFYEQALAISREINFRNLEILILSNLCGARLRLGDYQTAATDLEWLIDRAEKDWFGTSEANRFLAEAYLAMGKFDEALSMAHKALALAHPGNAAEHGRAWRVLGRIAAQTGQEIWAENGQDTSCLAVECFQKSIAYFEELGLERDRAISLWSWAQYEQVRGNRELGEQLWQEAYALFEDLRLPLFTSRMKMPGT